MPVRCLDRKQLLRGARVLAARDPDLAAVVDRFGPPPMWARRPGFATLVRIILEQQVSLASADAAYRRLQETIQRVTPTRFITLDGRTLHRCGFSRQKTTYCRELARAIQDGRIDLRGLEKMPDERAAAMLRELKGVGMWTSAIYLLMVMRRPDIWPPGDIALARSVQRIKRRRRLPDDDQLRRVSEDWRPWRSVAARMLWHDYLCRARLRRAGRGP